MQACVAKANPWHSACMPPVRMHARLPQHSGHRQPTTVPPPATLPQGMNAYERHKKMVHDLVAFYGGQLPQGGQASG